MIKSIPALTAGLCLTACAAVTAANGYKVNVQLPSRDLDKTMSYIVDYDSEAKLDSAIVNGDRVAFAGSVAAPVLARLVFDGKRGPIFVLEEGEIAVAPTGEATGTLLNKRINDYGEQVNAIMEQAQGLAQDSAGMAKMQELEAAYAAVMQKAVEQDGDNPVGVYFFMQNAYEMTLPELEAALKAHPALAKSERVAKLRQSMVAKQGTSQGAQFKDFAVTYDGKTEKLSDYVGKGKPVLVDFWASWCGPCIRATKTIKELYKKYGPEGTNQLDVLGVAVWDEPENTFEAVKSHALPWHTIVNAQSIPTEIYGIPAIPCIMLIDKDGKIVFRDLQGDALIEAVDAAMAQPAQ